MVLRCGSERKGSLQLITKSNAFMNNIGTEYW